MCSSDLIEDGTAIGSGLANSVSRLKNSDAISKVVILLTDGSNNRGSIPPLTAAEIAKSFGVRVYTIGVGTNGKAPIPVKDMFGQTCLLPEWGPCRWCLLQWCRPERRSSWQFQLR